MREVRQLGALREAMAEARRAGKRIGFVPTMGFLHEGHLRLVDEARRGSDHVVMSIFVNPLQFGAGEDLARYPRDEAGDREKARTRGVDTLFIPSTEEMYPSPSEVKVSAKRLAQRWEGAARPGHFSGVLTVVAKLFNLVHPDVAVFGQKDFQQATLVRAMVRDLNFPLDVVVAPTVREPDGLAMSSRNAYLSDDERAEALALVRSLRVAADGYLGGERRGAILCALGQAMLMPMRNVETDYFAVVDPDTLEQVETADDRSVAIVAARVGTTRLIDNMRLADPA